MMNSLDELVAADATHRAKVAACSHAFTTEGIGAHALGLACEHCGVHELVWLRGEVALLQAASDECARQTAEDEARGRSRAFEEMADAFGLFAWTCLDHGGEEVARIRDITSEARSVARVTSWSRPTVPHDRAPRRWRIEVNERKRRWRT